MKKLFLLALPLLIMMACTQEELIVVSENGERQDVRLAPRKWGDESLGIDTAAYKAIAQKLVMSDMPLSVCEDVHQIIQNSIEAGLGESCYLKEVISDSVKMWIPESNQTKNFFNNLLKFSYTGQSNDSIYITPDILDKVQIYWPYSENWDGETMPVITWYGERANSMTNFAYLYDNGQIRRLRVDDAYAEQHPVWIINSARYPHSCFPTLIIDDDNSSGARDLGDDEEEDDESKPKVIKDFSIKVHNMIVNFQKGFKIDPSGNTGGASIPDFITDENQIDSTKSYKIYVRLLSIPQNYPLNFDDGELYATFSVAYYDSRNISNSPGTHYTIYKNDLKTPNSLNKERKDFIYKWIPNGKDMALLVTIGKAGEYDSCIYSGILRYDAGIILNKRFNISYDSIDDIILQRKYTWNEFFSNEVMIELQESNGFKWTYFVEEL